MREPLQARPAHSAEDTMMRRLFVRLAVGFTAMAMTSGCAATISVSSHADRSVDFAQYRTFDWGPADALPTGDPRLDADPFFKDHVQGAVERGLSARGVALTSSGAPDLLIHYHANITERIDVSKVDRAYAACQTPGCAPESSWYEAGTLVLDVMDARTNTLVWRGWAQNSVEDMLKNRDVMAATIDRAVAEMLRQLPRRR
jgi:hypothetical protein